MASFKNRKKYKVQKAEETSTFRLTKMVKREMVLTAISVFGVLLVSMGSAYAVFTSFEKSKDFNTIEVGTLKISYQPSEASDSAYGDTLSLPNAFPISDEEGLQSKPYKFTLTNEGDLKASYTIAIKDDSDMISNEGCADKQLDKSFIKISVNGQDPVFLSSLLDVTKTSYIIAHGSLDAATEQNKPSETYEIRMWISDKAGNDVLGKHFHGKISISGTEYDEAAAQTSIIKADLTTKEGTQKIVTKKDEIDEFVQIEKSNQLLPNEYGTTSFVYDVVLKEGYESGNVQLSVADIKVGDSLKVYFYNGEAWKEIPVIISSDNQIQLTLTQSGTIAIVKEES